MIKSNPNPEFQYNEDQLRRLRNSLPHGYASVLQGRIEEKTGKVYAENSIRRHLTLKYVNSSTVEEALLLAAETKAKRQEKAKKVAHFR